MGIDNFQPLFHFERKGVRKIDDKKLKIKRKRWRRENEFLIFSQLFPLEWENEGEDRGGLEFFYFFKNGKTDGIKGKNGTTAVTP